MVLYAYKYASGIRNNTLMIRNNGLVELKAMLEKVRNLLDNEQIIEEIDGAIQARIADWATVHNADQIIEEIDDAIQELQRIIDLRDLKIPVNTSDTANLVEDMPELTDPYENRKNLSRLCDMSSDGCVAGRRVHNGFT